MFVFLVLIFFAGYREQNNFLKILSLFTYGVAIGNWVFGSTQEEI